MLRADPDTGDSHRVAGAALFGWSRSRFFGPAPTPLYFKYFIFTGP